MRMSNFDATPPVRMAVLLLIGGLSLLPGGAQAGYIYQNVINPGDPTFNQELGINNAGTIAGYFGSGAPNGTPPPFTLTPNQGYTVGSPYTSFTSENFPGSGQTQVIGINNGGVTVGFYADSNGATTPNFFGFVDQGNTFTQVNDPNTTGTGPTTNQLLGVNDNGTAAGFYCYWNGDWVLPKRRGNGRLFGQRRHFHKLRSRGFDQYDVPEHEQCWSSGGCISGRQWLQPRVCVFHRDGHIYHG